MARVVFTSSLLRHVACPDCEVQAVTLKQALDAAFVQQPQVRDYVLTEQGQLRRHVVIFVDGVRVHDRRHLTDAVQPGSEIHVLQALSGG